MIMKIAWKNVWRHKTRSLVIVCAVALGLWAGIFLIGFYNGMIEQRIASAIEKEISHIQIHHAEFREDYNIKFSIENPEKILRELQANPHIKVAAARTISKGMIANATGSSGVQINGVMPAEENSLTKLKEKISEGEYFSPGKNNQLIIGEKLARKMKAKLKSKMIISFQDKDGNIASGAFRIAGIFRTNNAPYDEANIFVAIGDLNALNSTSNSANEIAMLLKSSEFLNKTKLSLREKFPSLEIKDWKEISPEVGLMVSATDQSLFIFMAIILLALAFGIINTMLMSILERTHEIGVLLALGMNKKKIFSMILYETIFLVTTGCPFGIGFALLVITYFGNTGINLEIFSDALRSFGYENIVYPAINMRQLLIMLGMVVATAFFASIFPARKALGLVPVEAIRK